MAIFVKRFTPAEETALQKWCSAYDENSMVYKRLQALLLSQHRLKTSEIARQLGVAPYTVLSWIKRANQEGLGAWLETDVPQAQSPSEVAVKLSKEISPAKPTLNGNKPLFARPLQPAEAVRLIELLNLYQQRPTVLKRLQAIQLSSEGQTAHEISQALQLSNSTIRNWINRFNKEGITVLETPADKEWLNEQTFLNLFPGI